MSNPSLPRSIRRRSRLTLSLLLFCSTWVAFWPAHVFAQPATNCTPRPPGLIAWWPGDAVGVDVVGTNHAVLTNGAAYADGMAGRAFTFDGTTALLTTPIWIPANSFTVEGWLRPGTALSGTDGTCPISFGHLADPRSGWLIYQFAAGWNLRMYNHVGVNTALNITGGGSPVPGNWYHVAVSYDGTNAVLYVNGVASAQGAPVGYYPNTDGPFTPGSRSDALYDWKGVADEVAVYNLALLGSDIAAIYSAGSAGKCFTNDPAPVFVRQPVGQTGYTQNPLTFAGFAMGTPRPTFQWLKDGTPITQATNPILNFNSLELSNAGTYTLVASNLAGVRESEPASMTVLVPPFVSGVGSFESGFEGWTADNGGWEVGKPTAGPGQAHEGTNCAATVLGGDYPAYVDSRLVSPGITLPAVSGDERLELRFWSWSSYPSWCTEVSYGEVQVSAWTNGVWGDWKTLGVPAPGDWDWTGTVELDWWLVNIDLTVYAGQKVRLGFYHHGGRCEAAGWYIDELHLWIGVPGEGVDWETGSDFEAGWGSTRRTRG